MWKTLLIYSTQLSIHANKTLPNTNIYTDSTIKAFSIKHVCKQWHTAAWLCTQPKIKMRKKTSSFCCNTSQKEDLKTSFNLAMENVSDVKNKQKKVSCGDGYYGQTRLFVIVIKIISSYTSAVFQHSYTKRQAASAGTSTATSAHPG